MDGPARDGVCADESRGVGSGGRRRLQLGVERDVCVFCFSAIYY